MLHRPLLPIMLLSSRRKNVILLISVCRNCFGLRLCGPRFSFTLNVGPACPYNFNCLSVLVRTEPDNAALETLIQHELSQSGSDTTVPKYRTPAMHGASAVPRALL